MNPFTTAVIIILIPASKLGIKKPAGGSSGRLYFVGRASADAFRLAGPPHIRRQNGFMAFVDKAAYSLADQMSGEGKTGKTVMLAKHALHSCPCFGQEWNRP